MVLSTAASLAEAALRLRARFGGSPDLRQRLVLDGAPDRADIWVHGASVGELASARQVIEGLSAHMSVLVTANSATGRDQAAGWGFDARLAPLDVPGALERFVSAVQPRLAVTLESEFWPLRSQALARRGIPQAMIGARMSERSARRWQRLPWLIRPVLARIAAASAQDVGSQQRLLALGLPASALMPQMDLKLLAPAQVAPPPDDPARDRVVLAASTHEAEEAQILEAWVRARARVPDLRLILAIRHPQRGDEVAALIAARGITAARRSAGASDGPVVLVDVLGEMGRWYAAAGICVVGGSLTDRGGHTAWEPAAHRCAILYGPHVSNFADAYAALAQAGAARQVTPATLADQLVELAQTPAQARQMGQAARDLLLARAGDPAGLIQRLLDLAQPRRVHDVKGRRPGAM